MSYLFNALIQFCIYLQSMGYMTWNCSYFQFKYLNQSKGGFRCLRVWAHRDETLCDGYCAAQLIKI